MVGKKIVAKEEQKHKGADTKKRKVKEQKQNEARGKKRIKNREDREM